MINAVNIGKRIRTLRKERHISQERMAEDLGMYQADISNLERAIGGSGITDLFKLDLIASYFDISLVNLLNGFENTPQQPVLDNKDTENKKVKSFVIKNCQYDEVYDSFMSELELATPDNQIAYYSFAEYEDEPRFYRSKESIFQQLIEAEDDESLKRKLNHFCILSGEDYIDIFEKVEPEEVNICRYLIFIATEPEEDANHLIESSKGKSFAEIDVPIPNREPEDLFYVNYSDLFVVYRYRLMVETSLKNPSVYSDIDNISKKEKAILEKLKAACASEEAYKVWKKDLIDAKVKEVMEKQEIIACDYIFAGIGQYKEIIPVEMLDSFKCWINGNGSAFFCGSRPATKREIRTYVSQHIADDLLDLTYE